MELTDRQAAEVLRKLRAVRADLLEQLDQYSIWVGQLEREVANKHVLRYMGGPDFVVDALERLESATHIHTGSTAHMNFRQARDTIVRFGHGVAE